MKPEEKTRDTQQEEVDFFTRLMFGPPSRMQNPNEKDVESGGKNSLANGNIPLPQWLKNVDADEIFQHVDTLVTAAKELKPLAKKITPILEVFRIKNHSS